MVETVIKIIRIVESGVHSGVFMDVFELSSGKFVTAVYSNSDYFTDLIAIDESGAYHSIDEIAKAHGFINYSVHNIDILRQE